MQEAFTQTYQGCHLPPYKAEGRFLLLWEGRSVSETYTLSTSTESGAQPRLLLALLLLAEPSADTRQKLLVEET
jgi:hypothetical protein